MGFRSYLQGKALGQACNQAASTVRIAGLHLQSGLQTVTLHIHTLNTSEFTFPTKKPITANQCILV